MAKPPIGMWAQSHPANPNHWACRVTSAPKGSVWSHGAELERRGEDEWWDWRVWTGAAESSASGCCYGFVKAQAEAEGELRASGYRLVGDPDPEGDACRAIAAWDQLVSQGEPCP